MLKCVIVDDEQAAINLLTSFVEKVPSLELVFSSTSPIKALGYVQQNPVDLIFLDINMPDLSGLNFLELLNGKVKAVLTTAYTEYAVDSYKYGVLDYLVKPIPFENFLRAVQKAIASTQPVLPVKSEDNLPTLPPPDDFVFVKTDYKGKFIKIAFKDILYIEALKNYVSIYTTNECVVTHSTMKEVEERLPDSLFFRSHKSYIVSLEHIKAIDGNEIILQTNEHVPIGVTFRDGLFTILESKMMNTR